MFNFAIIGCGKIAPRHAAEIQKHGRLMAVCDIEKQKADAFAKQYGASAYYDIEALLSAEKDLHIVSVCTPNGLHELHSIKSLEAGRHVLCEKPLAISTISCRKMIDTAASCEKKLFVVKSTRYNPALQQLRKLLEQDRLGELYSFQLNCFWNRAGEYYRDTWRGKLFPDGGTLYTQFSHYIDAMLWLFGGVKNLNGFRTNAAHTNTIEFEDGGVVSFLMENGMLGGLNWSVNAFEKNMEISLSLLAEKGSIRIGGQYLNSIEYKLGSTEEIISLGTEDKANDYGSYKGSMSNHDKVYENLVMAINDEAHPFTNAQDGFKTVELIERIYNTIPLLPTGSES